MRLRITAALAAALSALAATPAMAGAAPTDTLSGRFLVELEGVQTTTWTTRHAAQFECDVNIVGGGTETVRFRAKPAVIGVRSHGRTALLTRGRGLARLDLVAAITRDGSVTSTGSAACADGDGGGGPGPATDCGTKRSRLSVDLRYLPGRSQRIGFEPDLVVPLGTFANCPEGGISWPSLLTRKGNGRRIAQVLPVAELFEHGKNIVVARGEETQDDGETHSRTTIRWSLSFKRIGEGEGRRSGS